MTNICLAPTSRPWTNCPTNCTQLNQLNFCLKTIRQCKQYPQKNPKKNLIVICKTTAQHGVTILNYYPLNITTTIWPMGLIGQEISLPRSIIHVTTTTTNFGHHTKLVSSGASTRVYVAQCVNILICLPTWRLHRTATSARTGTTTGGRAAHVPHLSGRGQLGVIFISHPFSFQHPTRVRLQQQQQKTVSSTPSRCWPLNWTGCNYCSSLGHDHDV